MAKRGAGAQLTDRNWEEEDETEEAGHFKQAGNEQINKRIIKKAKRRVSGSEPSNAFKGFQGFGNPLSTNTTSTPLATSTTFSGFKGFGPFASSPSNDTKPPAAKPETETSEGNKSQYMKQLKTLNQSVCDWVKTHISQDAYVDLSPVFKDYEKHLANLEKKFTPNSNATMPVNTPLKGMSGPSSSAPGKSEFAGFSRPIPTTTSSPVTNTSGVNGETCSNENNTSLRMPSNEAEPDDTAKTSSEVRSSAEKDAFYSNRCKLFFKRGDTWSELGVGMLSLKKVDNKIQVTMRNDTTLGKIVLNIFVNDDTSITRSGKNNVLVISVPNPPVFTNESDGDNTKPISYLIRVKTSENADNLHKEMKNSVS